MQACLKFLRERTLLEARMDRQVGSGGMAGQRQGPIVSLVLETTQIFFKVGHVLFLLDHFFRKARCSVCFRPT